MTKIEFFLLDSAPWPVFVQQACQLINRARWQRQWLYIHTGEQPWQERFAQAVEQQLQTPLARLDTLGHHRQHPLAIGGRTDYAQAHGQVLLNLCEKVPLFFSRFDCHWELIAGDEHSVAQAREKYRFYRDRGYALRHHKLSFSLT